TDVRGVSGSGGAMRPTREGCAAVSGTADTDLAALLRMYALHVGANGASADDAAPRRGALAAIVRAHRRMAAHRTSGESVVSTSTSRPAGSGTFFDVITDEMPFVVESLLA